VGHIWEGNGELEEADIGEISYKELSAVSTKQHRFTMWEGGLFWSGRPVWSSLGIMINLRLN
jgi:hypothetical protein